MAASSPRDRLRPALIQRDRFPSGSYEGQYQFRKMLNQTASSLTEKEIETLITSLDEQTADATVKTISAKLFYNRSVERCLEIWRLVD